MNLAAALTAEERCQLEGWFESRACAVPVADDRILCRVLAKYLMYVDARDTSITPHLVMSGYWEMWTTIAIARHVQPGMRCIDVGANVGYFTLLLADLAGDKGHVQAWEPQSGGDHDILLASAKLNGFAGTVAVLRRAASSDGGEGTLAIGDWGRDQCSATLMDPEHGVHRRWKVPRSRLDTENAEPVDFIKIDAEGHEPEVWEGMGDLRNQAGLTVAMEFSPGRYQDAPGFLDAILSAGFPLQKVDDAGQFRPLRRDEALDREHMLWLSRPNV